MGLFLEALIAKNLPIHYLHNFERFVFPISALPLCKSRLANGVVSQAP